MIEEAFTLLGAKPGGPSSPPTLRTPLEAKMKEEERRERRKKKREGED